MTWYFADDNLSRVQSQNVKRKSAVVAPLSVNGLTRTYGSLTAVDNITLSTKHGEIFALLGPNGAGKTTTMRMLAGLLKPSDGAIEVMGVSGRSLRGAQRRYIGYCPQRLIVWRDLTCSEQLVYVASMFRIPRRQGGKRAAQLLEMFGLSGKKDELAAHLSGGMQRRLSLALAMVHDPDISILDEPAAGLDPQSRVLVRERIRALSREKKKTIIVSTHDMEEADRIADRVAILDRGTLLALDTPRALKREHGTARLIEIGLPELSRTKVEEALVALGDLSPNVQAAEEMITIGVDEGTELIRPIRTVLGKLAIEPQEIRLRRRSLEDVFIDLTGRRLRE